MWVLALRAPFLRRGDMTLFNEVLLRLAIYLFLLPVFVFVLRHWLSADELQGFLVLWILIYATYAVMMYEKLKRR
jgi:hypothetical protein